MSLGPWAPAHPWKRVPCERPAPPHILDTLGLLCTLRSGQIWAEDIPLSPKKVCPHRASCVLGPLRDQMWEERGSHPLPSRKLTKAEKGGEGQGRGAASHGPQQSR